MNSGGHRLDAGPPFAGRIISKVGVCRRMLTDTSGSSGQQCAIRCCAILIRILILGAAPSPGAEGLVRCCFWCSCIFWPEVLDCVQSGGRGRGGMQSTGQALEPITSQDDDPGRPAATPWSSCERAVIVAGRGSNVVEWCRSMVDGVSWEGCLASRMRRREWQTAR